MSGIGSVTAVLRRGQLCFVLAAHFDEQELCLTQTSISCAERPVGDLPGGQVGPQENFCEWLTMPTFQE